MASIPDWVAFVFLLFTVVTVASYLSAYVFLLFRDRDALRSEGYSLQKMAIERGLFGDSLTGVLKGRELDQLTKGELEGSTDQHD